MPEDVQRAAPTHPRSPGLAAALTLLVAGLGHLYVGRPRAALIVLFALGLGPPLLLIAVAALDLPLLPGIGAVLVLALAVRLTLAILVAREAQRLGEAYALRPGNRLHAYLGFIALAVLLGEGAGMLRRAYGPVAYKSPSGSMAPTLDADEHFVATPLGDRLPERGDVIVFVSPLSPDELFIKRVVGLPGDVVAETDRGELVVNGALWSRRPCDGGPPGCFVERAPDGREHAIRRTAPQRREAIKVPKDHLWVRGDRRSEALDSTAFGPVPRASVRGRARAVFLPLDRLGAAL